LLPCAAQASHKAGGASLALGRPQRERTGRRITSRWLRVLALFSHGAK